MDPLVAMQKLLKHLLDLDRWGIALSLIRILVGFLEQGAKLVPYFALIEKCEAKARLQSQPALLTLVEARLYLATMMIEELNDMTGAQGQLQCVRTIVESTSWIVPQHTQYLMLRRMELDPYPSHAGELVDQLMTIAATCRSTGDKLMETQILSRINTRLNQIDALERDDNWNTIQEEVLERYSELHSDVRGRVLLNIAPLWHLGNTLGSSPARGAEFLRRLDKFETEYPQFDVPVVGRDLYRAAAFALRTLGREDEADVYESKKMAAHLDSPWDPSQFFRMYRDKEVVEWSSYVMETILGWIKMELEIQALSTDEVAAMLLIAPLDHEPQRGSLDAQVQSVLLHSPEALARKIIGCPLPVDYDEWGRRFVRFENWLLNSPSVVEPWIRHTILGDFQQCRCAAIRVYAQRAISDLGQVIDEDYHLDVMLLQKRENDRLLEVQKKLHPRSMGAAQHSIKLQQSVCMSEWASISDCLKAFKTKVVQDGHLKDAQSHYEHILSDEKTNYRPQKLLALSQLSYVQRQRYKLFGTIPADAVLDTLATYDRIYMHERLVRSVLKGSDSFVARTNVFSRWSSSNHYNFALGAIVEALGVGQIRNNYHRTILQDAKFLPDATPPNQRTTQKLFTELVEWAQRKKARSVTEALGAEIIIPRNALSSADLDDYARDLLRCEAEYQRKLDTNQGDEQELNKKLERVRAEMRNCLSLTPIMDLRDGRALTESQLYSFAQTTGRHVLIVDYLYLPRYTTGLVSEIVPMIYKGGRLVSAQFVTQALSYAALQRWVRTYMDETDTTEPLLTREPALKYLYPLIEAAIKHSDPGDTILVCPTEILFRIPIHAIELPNGDPWIQRNPIVYTQSLAIQRLCDTSASEADRNRTRRPLAVQALSEEDLALPGAADMAFASRTNARVLMGEDLTKEGFLSACAESRLINFYGHVHYNERTPLDQFLAIRDLDSQRISLRHIFDLRLQKGTHVSLIGCQSGRSQVGLNDDLLGFTTALLYAGAASTTTALWSIRMDDAAAFQERFYDELIAQTQESLRHSDGGKKHPKPLNLAIALQQAVLKIRLDSLGQPRAPYNWAAFTIHGCWNVLPPLDLGESAEP